MLHAHAKGLVMGATVPSSELELFSVFSDLRNTTVGTKFGRHSRYVGASVTNTCPSLMMLRRHVASPISQDKSWTALLSLFLSGKRRNLDLGMVPRHRGLAMLYALRH